MGGKKKVQFKTKYFQIKLDGVMYHKKGFCLLVGLIHKQVLKILNSQEVAICVICSPKFISPPPFHSAIRGLLF